jgi:hypothetical protein
MHNRDAYPAVWRTRIRPAALARAGHRCQCCRIPDGVFAFWRTVNGVVLIHEWTSAATKKLANQRRNQAAFALRVMTGDWPIFTEVEHVRLNVCHGDDVDPLAVQPGNLWVACARCHQIADSPARIRRARLQGTQTLFDETAA